MYRKKMEADIRCPLEYGLKVFGGKWKSRVICVLNEKGVLRYSAIRKEISGTDSSEYLQMGWYFSTGKQRQCDGAVPEMRLQQAIEQSLAVREYVPTGAK